MLRMKRRSRVLIPTQTRYTSKKKSTICRNGKLMHLAVTPAHISWFLNPGLYGMSTTTKILTLSSKSMHRWNPLCKGFILSHFGRACCVGQHCVLIHTIVRKSLVKYCKRRTKGAPRWERVLIMMTAQTPDNGEQQPSNHGRKYTAFSATRYPRYFSLPKGSTIWCSATSSSAPRSSCVPWGA